MSDEYVSRPPLQPRGGSVQVRYAAQRRLKTGLKMSER
jgi:hypothetical protein